MRKKPWLVLLALLHLGIAAACGNTNPSGDGPSGGGLPNPPGLVLQDSYFTAGPASSWIGHVELVDLAERIAVTRSYRISDAQFLMYNVGSPNQNIVVGIYSHDAVNDQPGSLIGTWSAPVSNAGLPKTAPGNPVLFTGLNVPVAPGTYWIVMHPVSGTSDNTYNYSIASGANTTHRGECHYNGSWNEFMNAQVIFSFYSGTS